MAQQPLEVTDALAQRLRLPVRCHQLAAANGLERAAFGELALSEDLARGNAVTPGRL
jgi:hypothetical protein